MKNLILILSVFMFISCNQDDDLQTPTQPTSTNTGTYIGNVDTYINGVFHSSLSKTIILSALSSANQFQMVNNIFMSPTCNITNNSLDIPSHTTATSPTFSVIEYGTGTFNGANLTIDFRQDNVNSAGTVNSTGKWTGTLVKQ